MRFPQSLLGMVIGSVMAQIGGPGNVLRGMPRAVRRMARSERRVGPEDVYWLQLAEMKRERQNARRLRHWTGARA